jgi:hypothetical protein
MRRCSTHEHVQVPKTNVSILLSYCHACMAWTRSSYSYMFEGESIDLKFHDHFLEYGPFDSVAQVLDETCDFLAHELFSPGRPWDQGAWALRDTDYRLPPVGDS